MCSHRSGAISRRTHTDPTLSYNVPGGVSQCRPLLNAADSVKTAAAEFSTAEQEQLIDVTSDPRMRLQFKSQTWAVSRIKGLVAGEESPVLFTLPPSAMSHLSVFFFHLSFWLFFMQRLRSQAAAVSP